MTERYVTVTGAGAHDGTSEADAWTFAEYIAALSASGAGYRVNAKNGSFTSGTVTLPSGTASLPHVVRGYNSTAGDLDTPSFGSTGIISTTNMPDMTITGLWTPGQFTHLENLDITGALSSALIGSTTLDDFSLLNCRIINTQNNASARAIQSDDRLKLINCDIRCTGAAHASVIDADIETELINCFVNGVSSSSLLTIDRGTIISSIFAGNAGAQKGIIYQAPNTPSFKLLNNTFYGLSTAVEHANTAPTGIIIAINNSVTDCSKWLDSLYVGSGQVGIIEIGTRIRDVTTPRTGFEVVWGYEITTDGGGAETDYTNAAGNDFTLISAAPGKYAGIGLNTSIGALQFASAGGGGGGGSTFGGTGGVIS